jgi:acetolactate synthase regulatory subunit
MQNTIVLSETGESQLFGTDIIKEGERQVRIIRENLRVAQSRQKSYPDGKRRDASFQEGDYVYLKVSPIRGLHKFKVKGKLSPRYIGPFQILQRVGEVAYRLDLPEQLSDVHDVFHISQLKRGLKPHDMESLPVDGLDAKEDLTITEWPIRILDRLTQVTRNRTFTMCKVQWSNHVEDEATWEREEELRVEYPHLFDPSESRGRDSS